MTRRLRPAVAALALGMALLLTVPPALPFDSEGALKEADGYLKRGLYLEAITAYREVAFHAASRDVQARAVVRMGEVYGQYLNDAESAMKMFALAKETYSASPSSADAYFFSGMILFESDRYGEAREEFSAYLRKAPRGERHEMAQFMMDACLSPPPRGEKKPGKIMPATAPPEEIRVLVEENRREIVLSSASSFEIRDLRGRALAKFAAGQRVVVGAAGATFRIQGMTTAEEVLTVAPGGSSGLQVEGKRYRGRFQLHKAAGGRLNVVNVLGLEEYLYGVVPREMPSAWPPEALKAQAVVSRTYAVYQKERNRTRDFDICNTTTSQVYGGCEAERASTSRAVDETRGRILTYNGRVALPYFHSNSGGVTEDAKNVWLVDIPYLKTVPDPLSLQAPNVSWSAYLDFDEIRGALARNGVRLESISAVEPFDTSPTGRVKRVRISHGGGEKVLNANLFRLHLDPQRLKSTLFKARKERQGILFEGKGSGHGVGMSQWGAHIMAKSGRTYGEILGHYYRGLEPR